MTCTGCPCCSSIVIHCIAKYFKQQLPPVKNYFFFSSLFQERNLHSTVNFPADNSNSRSCSSTASSVPRFLIPVMCVCSYCYVSDYLSLFNACHLLWSSCRASCVLLSDDTVWISIVGVFYTSDKWEKCNNYCNFSSFKSVLFREFLS